MLAGVWIDGSGFHPAQPGVEPIRGRLSDAGLVGWAELPPVLTPTLDQAGEVGLEIARATWPRWSRPDVPFPNGRDERRTG